jgi:hypothetical protein
MTAPVITAKLTATPMPIHGQALPILPMQYTLTLTCEGIPWSRVFTDYYCLGFIMPGSYVFLDKSPSRAPLQGGWNVHYSPVIAESPGDSRIRLLINGSKRTSIYIYINAIDEWGDHRESVNLDKLRVTINRAVRDCKIDLPGPPTADEMWTYTSSDLENVDVDTNNPYIRVSYWVNGEPILAWMSIDGPRYAVWPSSADQENATRDVADYIRGEIKEMLDLITTKG